MYLFYPLPVKPNYVRLKQKWSSSEVATGSHKQEKKEFDTAITSSHSDHRSFSIWDILMNNGPLHQNLTLTSALTSAKVSTFHLPDSIQREMELNKAFSPYMTQLCIKKPPHPLIEEWVEYYDLTQVLMLYQKFEILNQEYEDNKISNIFTCLKIDSPNYMTDLPAFDFEGTNIYTILSTVQQVDRIGKDFRDICQHQQWLKLISWWRLVHYDLPISFHRLYELLSIVNNNSSAGYVAKLKESSVQLEKVLKDSNLKYETAEFASVHIYTNITRSDPQIDMWYPSGSSDGSSNFLDDDHFYEVTSDDEEWVSLIVECGQFSISTVLSISETVQANILEPDLLYQVECALALQIEEFVDNVICVKNSQISSKRCVELLVSKSMKSISAVVNNTRYVRLFRETFECDLNIPVKLVKDMTQAMTKAIATNAILSNPQNRSNKTKALVMINNYISEIHRIGIQLAVKVYLKDFVTRMLVIELCKDEFRLSNKTIFTHNCAKVAHSILTMFETMFGKAEDMPKSVTLTPDYVQSDFKAFLEELAFTVEPLATRMELNFTEYCCQQKLFRNTVNIQINKMLSFITDLAHASTVLLLRASRYENVKR